MFWRTPTGGGSTFRGRVREMLAYNALDYPLRGSPWATVIVEWTHDNSTDAVNPWEICRPPLGFPLR